MCECRHCVSCTGTSRTSLGRMASVHLECVEWISLCEYLQCLQVLLWHQFDAVGFQIQQVESANDSVDRESRDFLCFCDTVTEFAVDLDSWHDVTSPHLADETIVSLIQFHSPAMLQFREFHLVVRCDVETHHLAIDRKSTRLNSSHIPLSRMPSS